MFGSLISLIALLGCAAAQIVNYSPGTGTRSLWIPYRTLSGIPVASILDHDTTLNQTTYVISCPTGQPQCAIAPNVTLTAGTNTARWWTSTSGSSSGTVVINCPMLTSSPVTCSQQAAADGNIQKTSQVLAGSNIAYQAVLVTATQNNTSTLPQTVTVTAQASTTSSSSTSSAGAEPTGAPWAMGGALGAGLVALAAL